MRDRDLQSPGQTLEASLDNVMVVGAIQRLDMQRAACGLREGLKPFLEQFRVHLTQFVARKFDVPDQVGPVRQVERHARQRFIHGNIDVAVAVDAPSVAKSLGHRLADSDTSILSRVVKIDVQIAFGPNRQVDKAVPR